MKRTRKYHCILAIIISLPLAVTILPGMSATVIREWFVSTAIESSLILSIHTGEIALLQAIYPILNGLGLIGF